MRRPSANLFAGENLPFSPASHSLRVGDHRKAFCEAAKPKDSSACERGIGNQVSFSPDPPLEGISEIDTYLADPPRWLELRELAEREGFEPSVQVLARTTV